MSELKDYLDNKNQDFNSIFKETKQCCIFCKNIFNFVDQWDVYCCYYNNNETFIFRCIQKSCKLRLIMFWDGISDKLKLKSQELLRTKIQCAECKTLIPTKPKCIKTSFGKSGKGLSSILCSDDCIRSAIKISKMIGNILKKEDEIDNIQFKCSGCSKMGSNYMKCGKCRIKRYCSKECQIADWKAGHKKECSVK